jgi:hypothetical protein
MVNKKYIELLILLLISILFASCGGGSGSDSHAPSNSSDDINTDVPILDPLPNENENSDVPSDGVPPDQAINDNHFLGPEYGEELSLYHAILVMKVLRTLGKAGNEFVGIDVGEFNYLSYEYYDYKDELDKDQINGGLFPCEFTGEPHGTRSVTWHDGDPGYPAQYTSTRMYNDCKQGGLSFGDFYIYDGTIIQSGILDRFNNEDVITSGNIHADQLELTNEEREVSIAINGYIGFNRNLNAQRNTEILEIGLTIREDNNSWKGGAGRYIEDISVHGGKITFGPMDYETQIGIGTIIGVKHASVRIDVENNNHKHIALLVKTVTPTRNDVIYSLEISRAELSDQPQPTHHNIRIDRMQPGYGGGGYLSFNVYIDLNDNGVIDTEYVYPKEFYEDEALQNQRWERWGYINGL